MRQEIIQLPVTELPPAMAFHYKRCCRVHKLIYGLPYGRCKLCKQRPTEQATLDEYLAQPPLTLLS